MKPRFTTIAFTWAFALSGAALLFADEGTLEDSFVFQAGETECAVSFGPASPISALAFSPDGRTLAVGGYREVLLWDLVEAKLAKRIGVDKLDGRVAALAFLADGSQIAAGDGVSGRSGAVRLFDVAGGKLLRTFTGPADTVRCLAVSPDGKLLAAGGAFREVHVWTVEDGKPVQSLSGNDDWVAGVAFSPDGQLLASAGADKTLQIWKVETWERALRAVNPGPAHALAFSGDSRNVHVAVGGTSERTVRSWRTDNARSSRAVATDKGMPLDLRLAEKTRKTFVAASDGTVQALPAGGGRASVMTGHTDWVYALALSADESRLASGSADGTVRLWNTADGKPIAALLQLAPRSDRWLIVTAQGRIAASSSKDLKLAPDGQYEKLQDVDAVRKALAGEQAAEPTKK